MKISATHLILGFIFVICSGFVNNADPVVEAESLIIRGGIELDPKHLNEMPEIIKEQEIAKESRLHRRDEIEFIVKTEDNENIAFTMQSTDTVGQLKNKIERKLKIPVKEQFLSYQNEELKSARTLEFYDITNDAIIQLESR